MMCLIMETGATAHTIWTNEANLFLDNKVSQAMTLEAKLGALPKVTYRCSSSLNDLRTSLMGSPI